MRKLPTLLALWLISAAGYAADNGFYLGAGAGFSNFTTEGKVTDESKTGYKLIGGFRLLDSLAVELNYADFGKASIYDHYTECGSGICGVGDTSEPTALAGFVVWFLNFPLLDAFAKLGAASIETRTNVSGVSAKHDTTDVAWGIGIQGHFGSFAVRGEYEQYKYELNLSHGVRLYSVSFLYTFL